MNAIDHFEYGTWEVRKNARETTKHVGYKYGHLALLRTDFLCENCGELHECWSVANLASGAYPYPSAVFRNVDDGTNYIYAITPLASWDTIDPEGTAKLAVQILKLCLDHNGLPMRILMLMDKDKLPEEGVLRGIIASLNGYTKQ